MTTFTTSTITPPSLDQGKPLPRFLPLDQAARLIGHPEAQIKKLADEGKLFAIVMNDDPQVSTFALLQHFYPELAADEHRREQVLARVMSAEDAEDDFIRQTGYEPEEYLIRWRRGEIEEADTIETGWHSQAQVILHAKAIEKLFAQMHGWVDITQIRKTLMEIASRKDPELSELDPHLLDDTYRARLQQAYLRGVRDGVLRKPVRQPVDEEQEGEA